MLDYFACFSLSAEFFADFLPNQLLKKKSGIPSVSKHLNPDQAQQLQLLSLIWVQIVCIGYQQTTLAARVKLWKMF